MKEIWKNFVAHTKSSRFCIIMITILISFVAAIIKTKFVKFPFVGFAGIINGLSIGSYILKSFGAGEKERRINNIKERNNHDQ